MEALKIVETTVVKNVKKFNLFVVIFMFGGVSLTIFAAVKLHYTFVIFLGVFIFVVSPFLFQKRFRKAFSENATVSFFSDYFSIDFKEINTDAIVKTDINRFDQIKFFKIYDSTENDFSSLKLIFSDNTKISYTFSNQRNDGSSTDINVLVRNYIKAYNSGKTSEAKIKIIPNLFATTSGLYFIAILIAMMITTLVFEIIYKPKTIPFSLTVFALIYLGFIAMRKIDIRDRNNFD